MDWTEKVAQEKKRWEKEKDVHSIPGVKGELGQEIQVLYTPADVETDYLRDLGFPGEYPFTRGVYPGMYRTAPWQMRLYAGYGTAEDTNKRWKFLLASGNMGVGCAFDLPTQMGLDSDDPLAEEDVGRLGVAIDSLADMEMLYEGLPLDKITSSFNIVAPCGILLAMYVALAEKQGVPLSSLRGTLANDILCEYVSRGCWAFKVEPSLRLATDVVEYCTGNLPLFYPYNIRTILMREAGASMVQEIAFGFSNAITYVEAAIKRGIAVDEFAPRISFFFCSGLQIFEEAAKYRAARRLWARIMKERFGATKPASMLLRFTATLGGSVYRVQEPENNLVRGAYGVLANVLGGAQGMLHPGMDEAYTIPSERAQRLALRTQQICAYETGVTRTVDPLGGSYYVEALTNHIEERISGLMQGIESMGGAVKAIENGYMQREIAGEAYRMAKEEESGERIVVGVNRFKSDDERELDLHRVDPLVRQRQVERLQQVRARRNSAKVKQALERLALAARGSENLMPYLIDAVKTYATVGEVFTTLKEVFGTFREPVGAV